MDRRPSKHCCLLLLSAGCMVPGMASVASAAEADKAPTIVVTGQRDGYHPEAVDAGKTGTSVLNTPQSVAVIGRQQLDDQAAQQLNDALRYVPGVTLGQGEGHRDQVVLRGQSTTADFFLDGLRDDAEYYRPLYNTDHIEVLKGANALLFGRGGGGGIVNRVSKVPQIGKTAGTVSGGGDTFGAWSISGDATAPLGTEAAIRLNATYEDFANHRDVYDGRFIGIAPTVAVALGEATRLTLGYEFDSDRRVTDRGVPSRSGAPIVGYDRTFFGSPSLNRSKVDAHIVRAILQHELTDNLTLHVSGLMGYYDKYYANVQPAGATATTVSLTGYDNTLSRTNWIGQANLVWKGETGGLRHTLLAGFEAGDQASSSGRNDFRFGGLPITVAALGRVIAVPPSTLALTGQNRSKVRSLSAYVQDQIEVDKHLQLIVGARYDDFSITAVNLLTPASTKRSDRKWSPRLGLIVKPVPNVSIYASYAKSFLPQSGDQFNTLAANLQTLKPEAFRNLEAGIKWDLSPALTLTGALFQVDRTNSRSNDPLTGNPVVTGQSRVRGFEAALIGRIIPAWQASLGYNYQTGEILSATTAAPAGRQLDKLPHHQLSAWTRYDLSARLGIGLGLIHQSSQFASISNAVRLPAFSRVDAAVYFNVTDRVALQLNVENLTDTRYYASAHTDNNIAPGAPLNARLTARIKL